MRLKYTLCMVGVALLLLNSLTFAELDVDEDEVEDSDDGTVEDEDTLVVHRERPVYTRPVPNGRTYLNEPFDTRSEFLKRWILSQAKKDGAEDAVAKYDGKWEVEEAMDNPINGDLGLVLKSKAKHHAIATKLDRIYEFKGKPFIVQYEVRFQNGMDCGGAYIKLLSSGNLNLKTFTDKTPYTIMFGPDKCGNDHKLHFIFRHKNPKTGKYEEKHAEKPSGKLDSFFSDKRTHLFTLIVNPDNSYEVRVDNALVTSGDLLTNVNPPVNPPAEIEDPNDKKPADWDNREKIPDAEATKPDDWDESEPATIEDESAEMPAGWLEDVEVYIPDPNAVKPEDWDDEMDGEWEAPLVDNPECKDAPGCGKWVRPTVPNPKYKGVWKPPMIDNPDYKGEWKPRRIANPDYFEDTEPYKMTPIEALGLELWSMTDDIVFDNFIIADNLSLVEDFTAITWEVKSMEERSASSTGGWWHTIKSSAEERPWLWAVYVVVLLLPIVLLSICLCPKSGPIKPEEIEAHRKKFDDPTPDVVEEVEEEEKSTEDAEDAEDDKGARGDAVENDAADKEEEEEEGKNEKEEGGAAESGAAGDGAAEQAGEEAGAEEQVEGSPKSNSPRKRRARKE